MNQKYTIKCQQTRRLTTCPTSLGFTQKLIYLFHVNKHQFIADVVPVVVVNVHYLYKTDNNGAKNSCGASIYLLA